MAPKTDDRTTELDFTNTPCKQASYLRAGNRHVHRCLQLSDFLGGVGVVGDVLGQDLHDAALHFRLLLAAGDLMINIKYTRLLVFNSVKDL